MPPNAAFGCQYAVAFIMWSVAITLRWNRIRPCRRQTEACPAAWSHLARRTAAGRIGFATFFAALAAAGHPRIRSLRGTCRRGGAR